MARRGIAVNSREAKLEKCWRVKGVKLHTELD